MTLQEYLQARLDGGMKKAHIAQAVGVDPNYVTRWLAGDQPRPETCRKIAEAFGLGEDDVLIMAGHKRGSWQAPKDDAELEAAVAEARRILRSAEQEHRPALLGLLRQASLLAATPQRSDKNGPQNSPRGGALRGMPRQPRAQSSGPRGNLLASIFGGTGGRLVGQAGGAR